jgi:hypothetical protein
MQHFSKNIIGVFKQISTFLFSNSIFFVFHKTKMQGYKTKRAKHKTKAPRRLPGDPRIQ